MYIHILCVYAFPYDRRAVGGAGQQVVHDKQEHCVAQDKGHLKGAPVYTVRWQEKAEEVHSDEEAAWDEEIYHIENWSASQDDLVNRQKDTDLC